MNWVENHPPRVQEDQTVGQIAFRAFQPNPQLTNNEVHAIIARGRLDAWAFPGDLLLELRKSYPDCDFDNPIAPNKVIFKGKSGEQFYTAFEEYKEKVKATQIG
jgi:hypothetical protein